MTEPLVAAGALVVITALVVVASLLVENGWRRRVPIPRVGPNDLPEPAPSGRSRPERLEPEPPPPVPQPVELLVEREGARNVLVAALLATYAAARQPEASRVAAWVTSAGWPEGRTGSAYRPGVNLRGRPAAVQQLLECDVGGRCWVALNTDVDVERGLKSRPATCGVLQGVCTLRRAILDGSPLDGAELESAAAALEVLRVAWSGTTVGGALDELQGAVREAAALRVPLSVSVATPPSTMHPGRGAPHRDVDHERPIVASA